MAGGTLDFIHLAILRDAADIANREWAELFNVNVAPTPVRPGARFNAEARRRAPRRFASGEVFRADPAISEKGGLCLSINEAVTMGMNPSEIQDLHEMGVRAIREAIMKNRYQFVGLMIGEAREKRNYFSRFPTSTGQGRLF